MGEKNRLDLFLPSPPWTELQEKNNNAIAIFYFSLSEMGRNRPSDCEIYLYIYIFHPTAQACQSNNIMVEIMTSKPACHKAIDAPFGCKMGSQRQIRPTTLHLVNRLGGKNMNNDICM